MRSTPLLRRALGPIIVVSLSAMVIGLSAPAGAAATHEAAPSGAMSVAAVPPPSASTCSNAVCIFVTGSGLTVTDWSTTAFISTAMCSTASFWVNGSVRKTGVPTCGPANSELGADWSSPGHFANGTILCNTWSGVSGKPCITVHS